MDNPVLNSPDYAIVSCFEVLIILSLIDPVSFFSFLKVFLNRPLLVCFVLKKSFYLLEFFLNPRLNIDNDRLCNPGPYIFWK